VKSRAGARTAVLGLVLLVAGCGAGSGEGLDAAGNLPGQSQDTGTGTGGGGGAGGGAGGGGGASGNPNATLAWAQSNVFGGVCSQCHTGGGAPLGVNWSTDANTCSNVGRVSGEMPNLSEITRGDPATSYVIWKLEGQGPNGEAIGGVRMPASNPALSPATIQNIRDWIADGAPGC
jgi:hypothetical protein